MNRSGNGKQSRGARTGRWYCVFAHDVLLSLACQGFSMRQAIYINAGYFGCLARCLSGTMARSCGSGVGWVPEEDIR